jgi:predicted RNA binding protein YcfA (HicA-like mRNA interferase family)
MGRLAGFKYQQVAKRLIALGLILERKGKGSHEIWYNPKTDCFTVLPHHGSKDVKEGTLRNMLKQAGISVDEFLDV